MSTVTRVPSSRRALVAQIDLRGPHRRSALRARMTDLVATITGAQPREQSTSALLALVEQALLPVRSDTTWLALAVISGRLPNQATVQRCVRIAALDGPLVALAETLTIPSFPPEVPGRAWPAVRIVVGHVLVDLQHTAATDLATGIQRVARQTAARWQRDHEITLVGWTGRYDAVRELDPVERARALGADAPARGIASETPASIVVPWRCCYLSVELSTERARNGRLQSMFRFSGNVGSAIGFDLVPITSAETAAEGMGAGFATMLAAAAHARRIATISDAAAVEYRGWKEMLSGAGLPGPEIRAISLATEASEPSPAGIEAARAELVIDDQPMVLCVGSHEPRKNHLAVLHAAELLWRDGLRFRLVFVGGNSWRGERFTERVAQLQAAGRPIISKRALADDHLWAAYRLARCVVFPSLNEGFGLPVVEALASGTPVVTSDFGSMQELAAAGGGALLVSPHNDHEIAAGIRRLLTDDGLHAQLSAQARARPVRTWDEYAAEAWDFLTVGCPPL